MHYLVRYVVLTSAVTARPTRMQVERVGAGGLVGLPGKSLNSLVPTNPLTH